MNVFISFATKIKITTYGETQTVRKIVTENIQANKRNKTFLFMNKTLLFTVLAAGCASAANAQNWTTQNFANVEFVDDFTGEGFNPLGCFNHVSANGKFAVGYDDQQLANETGNAFLWRASNPTELEQLSTTTDRISACDVTNDGMIVGGFEKRTDPEENAVQYPGYKPLDGDWVQLEVPDSFSTNFAKSQNFTEEARAVTPDGQWIAGNLHYRLGTKETILGVSDVCIQPVTVWKKEGEGYVLDTCYTELGKAGNSYLLDNGEWKLQDKDVNYDIFLVRDISNDGKTIIGKSQSGTGGYYPAFDRNGKLYQLFNCGEEDWADEEKNFNGGELWTIDAAGNMYGGYVDAEGTTKYFVYTVDGKLEYVANPSTCGTADGKRFSSSDAGLPYLLDCSEDGNVVVGGALTEAPGGAANCPALSYTDKVVNSVDRLDKIAKNVSVELTKGGTLYVNGEYQKASVYNAAGQLVAEGRQGKALHLGGANSAYIVKVLTADGSKTFKIAK